MLAIFNSQQMLIKEERREALHFNQLRLGLPVGVAANSEIKGQPHRVWSLSGNVQSGRNCSVGELNEIGAPDDRNNIIAGSSEFVT